MPKASQKFEKMVADLLARVETLGVADREVERGAGLPQGFLKKTRAGRNRDERAAASWAKLSVWFASRGGPASKGLASPAAPPETPEAQAEATAQAFRDLAIALGEARTVRRVRKALALLSVMVTEGKFDQHIGRVAQIEKLAARTLRAIKEEQAELGRTKVRSLEILTEEEAALLRAHREKLAGPPMLPGESTPPPPPREDESA